MSHQEAGVPPRSEAGQEELLDRLNRLCGALLGAGSPQDVAAVVEDAAGLLGCSAARLVLRAEPDAGLEAAAPGPWEPGMVREVLGSGRAVTGRGGLLGLPLRGAGGEVLGALLVQPEGGRPGSPALLELVAGQCALACERLGGRAGEAHYRRLVEASPFGIVIGDPDGAVSSANDAYLELVGCTREAVEAGEVDWTAFVPPEYHPVIQRSMEQFERRGAAEPYEMELLTRQGARVPVRVSGAEYGVGGRRQRVGYVEDLRAQKSAEKALHQLNAELESRVAARTAELELETAALDAFTRFTELAADTNDVLELAERAVGVLRLILRDVSVGYYQSSGDLWVGRVLSEDVSEAVRQAAMRGFPRARAGLPTAQGEQVRGAVFVDGWDGSGEGVEETAEYGAAAGYTYVRPGQSEATALLTLGTRAARSWTPREKTVFRAVGRSLQLALERAEQAREVEEQRAALEIRTRALEAFATITRDVGLAADPQALVAQAQALVMPHLPDGFAVYLEPGERDGGEGVWRNRAQWGDFRNAELQRRIDQGVPLDALGHVLEAYRSGEPLYLDVYDPGAVTIAGTADHVRSAAMLPLLVNGQVRGVFNLTSLRPHRWTEAERALLETVVRSLGLATELAEQARRLREQHASLELRTTALESANEELEAFSYSVSHDLRTPVRHIVGFSELLGGVLNEALGENPDPKVARYLTVVREAAQRMNALIDSMLDLSRTSRLPLRLEPVDLHGLVGEVRRELELDLGGREVRWELGSLPTVMADLDTLRQVMTNLISNALKYSRNAEVTRVEIWSEERPEELAVLVRDHGVGFDPRFADKLFGVFQRLHRHDEFEGTGVGLANVRRIVARHGGRVWAESEPGRGATFGFSLPRQADLPPA